MNTKKEYKYLINGKTYVQRPLGLGVIPHIREIINDLAPPSEVSFAAIGTLLREKLPSALAVILTEEGQPPKDKNINDLAEELKKNIGFLATLNVVQDFFILNPAISQRLIDLIKYTCAGLIREYGLKVKAADN